MSFSEFSINTMQNPNLMLFIQFDVPEEQMAPILKNDS